MLSAGARARCAGQRLADDVSGQRSDQRRHDGLVEQHLGRSTARSRVVLTRWSSRPRARAGEQREQIAGEPSRLRPGDRAPPRRRERQRHARAIASAAGRSAGRNSNRAERDEERRREQEDDRARRRRELHRDEKRDELDGEQEADASPAAQRPVAAKDFGLGAPGIARSSSSEPIAERSADWVIGPKSAKASLAAIWLKPQLTQRTAISSTASWSRGRGAFVIARGPIFARASDKRKRNGGGPFLGPAPVLRRRPISHVSWDNRSRRRRPGWRLDDRAIRGRSEPGEISGGIDRGRALAQFEVQLRSVDVAALAGLGDDLAALDRVAALDVELAIVGVGGDEAIGMADQNQIAVAFQLAAGIGDDAVFRGPHRGALGNGNVDAVVVAGFEALNDAAARRPAEFRRSARRVGLGRGLGLGRCRRGRAGMARRRRIDSRSLDGLRLGFGFGLGLAIRLGLGLVGRAGLRLVGLRVSGFFVLSALASARGLASGFLASSFLALAGSEASASFSDFLAFSFALTESGLSAASRSSLPLLALSEGFFALASSASAVSRPCLAEDLAVAEAIGAGDAAPLAAAL